MVFKAVLAIIIGYLLGSIPFALILGKIFGGVDVRKHGSGNLGGTNVIRVLGAKVGIPVIILDIAKGFLAAWLGSLLGGEVLALVAGVMAIIGHFYPVFAGFKGGKGVATGAGVFFFLAPFQLTIVLVVFIVVLLFFGYVSLASIIGAITGMILIVLPEFITGMYVNFLVRLGGLAVGFFVIYKHRNNIKKLIIGEEKKIIFNKKKNRK